MGGLLYTKTRSSLALVKYLQSVEHFTFEIPYYLDLRSYYLHISTVEMVILLAI